MKSLYNPIRLPQSVPVSDPQRTTTLLERLKAARQQVPAESIQPPAPRIFQHQRKFRS